jgi:hypothetical protein
VVREESHLDEMRAAIRGDFERLERRLGAQELMQVAEPDEPEAADEQAEQADAVEHAEQAGAGEPPEPPEPPAEQPSRSWLDRVLGR